MSIQNSSYSLALKVKQIFKESLKNKVQVRDFLPMDKSHLPCLIISCEDCKLQPVGLGGIINIEIKDKVDIGIVEGIRLLGTFRFDIWVEKATDSFEKLENLVNVLTDTIEADKLTLRKNGILSASVEKIGDMESSKDKTIWQIKEEGVKKSLDYRILYENCYTKVPDEGVIKRVEVEIKKDGFKEKMVIEKKIEVSPAPAPIPTPTPPEPQKVNINIATVDELTTLFVKYGNKSTAKKLAEEIVKKREKQKFEKLEDIMKTKGITEAIFNKIKDAISI